MKKVEAVALVVSLVSASGCSLLKPQPPGQVEIITEPDLNNEYYLYKPTHYQGARTWPLVVLCPSSPWEDPQSVIADWAQLAEDKGLLLLAPQLNCTADWPPKPENQQQLQEKDEEKVLAAIQHVRAACQVADDKVFIAGSKSGCRAALFIGLRNPDVFRLVALLRPRFDAAHTTSIEPFIDPYQRVLVVLAMGDWSGEQSKACRDWLRSHKMAVAEANTAARPEKYPAMAYRFFRSSVAKHPWIRVRAFQTSSPMRVRFQALSSFEDVYKYEWDFGDGGRDVIAGPEHEYTSPSEYQVTLKIFSSPKDSFVRKIRIAVPSDYTTGGVPSVVEGKEQKQR